MEEQEQPKKRKREPKSRARFTEQQIKTFDEIFPGFGAWYRESYDEDGNLKPSARILGLRGEP